jgi:F5/8 type C domain
MVPSSRTRSWKFALAPLAVGLVVASLQCGQPERATNIAIMGGAGSTGNDAAGAGAGTAGDNGTAGDGAAGTTPPLAGTSGTNGGTNGTTPDAGAAGTTAAAGTNGAAGTTAAAGTSGAAGTVAVNGCDRVNWKFTPEFTCDYPANPSCNFQATARLPQNAIDGDPTTRYTDGMTQVGGEYVVLDFGGSVKISGLTMVGDPTAAGDSAKAYAVQYSTDGTTFMAFTPAVAGTGGTITITIAFPAATVVRAVKITQTGKTVAPATSWWSISELTPTNCVQP